MEVTKNVAVDTYKACRICCTLHVMCLNNRKQNNFSQHSNPSANRKMNSNTHQLIIRYFRTILIKHKPPSRGCNCCSSNIDSNSHVSKKQPTTDESFLSFAWGLHHYVNIRRVEAECRGRGSVCHKVHPKQLNWDECFWHSKGCSQENATKRQQNCYMDVITSEL